MNESILIVDDSVIMRGVLKKTLGMIGFDMPKIKEAKNGQEALDCLAKENIQLMITDLNMPVLSGFELVERLKANTNSAVKILVVSTEGSEIKTEKLVQYEGVSFLRKPFKPETLSRKLKELVGE